MDCDDNNDDGGSSRLIVDFAPSEQNTLIAACTVLPTNLRICFLKYALEILHSIIKALHKSYIIIINFIIDRVPMNVAPSTIASNQTSMMYLLINYNYDLNKTNYACTIINI